MWSDWQPLPENCMFFSKSNYFFFILYIRLSMVIQTSAWEIWHACIFYIYLIWGHCSCDNSIELLFWRFDVHWDVIIREFLFLPFPDDDVQWISKCWNNNSIVEFPDDDVEMNVEITILLLKSLMITLKWTLKCWNNNSIVELPWLALSTMS